MKESERSSATRRVKRDKSERMLELLVAEAIRRGDSLTDLARHLGVSYGRLAQWRRGEGSIRTAHPQVLTAAAHYLRIPKVLALAFAGYISLEDLQWPSPLAQEQRLHVELQLIAAHPMVGPFVPYSLGTAPLEIRAFVVFLFREFQASESSRQAPWFAGIRDALNLLDAAQSNRDG
ncbi:hypothetical protein AAFF27_10975 [Xylophilus sp. GW821-FHT01B05]